MMKKRMALLALLIIACLISINISIGAESVQPITQTNKIFLNPFYRASMTSGTNYTYNVTVSPNNNEISVSSAIISFDVYMTPTVTFQIWINNKTCNTPSFTISTTYASSGQGRITFDCSNLITKAGAYTITLKPTSANTGALTGWIDVTYSNKPKGELTIHGTEYTSNQIAKAWLQLIDTNGSYINNGVCYVDIYTPTGGYQIEGAQMVNMNHDGIYYYNIDTTLLGEGVYPVIAKCYYIAEQIWNYANSYFIMNGSYQSGAITNTYTIENSVAGSLQFKEEPAGNPRRLQVGVNLTNSTYCSNISKALMTGIGIRVVGRFNSAPNDDLTISIWNYTSSSWMNFPNKLMEGNVWRDVSNSLSFNNITNTGFVNGSGSNIRIKFLDTALADGTTDTFELDYISVSCNQLSFPEWQQVKGSSEFHISSSNDQEFYQETLCGVISTAQSEATKSGCAIFKNNLSYWNISWGYIYDQIYIVNNYQKNIDDIESYETSLGQDCTSIIDIIQTKNNVTSSIIDNVTLATGSKDNCILGLPIVFNSTEREIYFDMTFDNYMKWEVQRNWDYVNYFETILVPYCSDIETQFGVPFTIPIDELGGETDISSLYADNQTYLQCYRIMDDLYWFDYYYNLSFDINRSGDYESYLVESQYYYPELQFYFGLIKNVTISINSTVSINASEISEAVWNYNGTVNPNLISQFVGSIWAFTSTISANILGQISASIWNNVDRNLTYYPSNNLTAQDVSNAVWNATSRNLTYYEQNNQTDMTNYTLINEGVWIYPNRTLTENISSIVIEAINQSSFTPEELADAFWGYNGTVNNNILNQFTNAVWNYTSTISNNIITSFWSAPDRNLTYYPMVNQTDLTNYTKIGDEIWDAHEGRYVHGIVNS